MGSITLGGRLKWGSVLITPDLLPDLLPSLLEGRTPQPVVARQETEKVGWTGRICDIMLLGMTRIIRLWLTPSYLRGSNESYVMSFIKGNQNESWEVKYWWVDPDRCTTPFISFSVEIVLYLFPESVTVYLLKKSFLTIYANWAKQELETTFQCTCVIKKGRMNWVELEL